MKLFRLAHPSSNEDLIYVNTAVSMVNTVATLTAIIVTMLELLPRLL